MPLSSVTRVSDGIQKQYDFDFGYLRKSHVFVFVNNELRSFKWLGPFQIELLNFPQPDDTVTIRRLTDRVNRITTFTDGQTILAEDLNAADLQTFYIAQEMLDQIEERILAGEVSVIGAGYITAQWIQEQLAANIAGSTQFQAISDALDNEALERANALAAEAIARAADIAAEAAARGDAVFALEQADLEAGQRLDVLEAEVDDPDTGIKARIGTLETVAVDLENNKADASVVSAIQAAVDAAEAQITTIDEALATETAARTSQIAAASSRLDGAEATLTSLGLTVTNLATSKAEASDLSALTARVGTAEAAIVSESAARSSGDSANATSISQLVSRVSYKDALNRNSDFTERFSSGDPPGWGVWVSSANAIFATLTGLGRGGVVATTYDPSNSGLITGFLDVPPGTSKVVLRGRARRYAGTLQAAAVWLNVFNNAYTYLGSLYIHLGSERTTDGTAGAAPVGYKTWEKVVSLPAGSAYMTLHAMNTYPDFFGAPVYPVGIEWAECSVIPLHTSEGAVTLLREAMATGSSSIARLLLGVNTTTNVATIEAVAAEGEGIWNGSAITLQADLIRLLARNIDFGTRTQFEDTRGTLYNTEAGRRLRILGPFGASNDLVLWYGNSSVPLQSETKTNGAFGIATDGKVYIGGGDFKAGISVGLNTLWALGETAIGPGGATVSSATVTATITGAVGTLSGSWVRVEGDAGTSAATPFSATTYFYGHVPDGGQRLSYWRYQVTDSQGSIGLSPILTVELRDSTLS